MLRSTGGLWADLVVPIQNDHPAGTDGAVAAGLDSPAAK